MARRRKHRTHKPISDEELDKIPRSFVFRRGKVKKNVNSLICDLRQMLLPHTARNLQVTKSNTLKDFVAVSGPLGISHMFAFNQNNTRVQLQICKTRGGTGPTLILDIDKYSLCEDVRKSQEKPRCATGDYISPPLVVLSGFSKCALEPGMTGLVNDSVKDVMATMFPHVDAADIGAKNGVKRVCVFDYSEGGIINLRQYAIVKDSSVMNFMNRFRKVRESRRKREKKEVKEVKEEPVDADDMKNIFMNGVELIEIGPRITMTLRKVRAGIFSGNSVWESADAVADEVEDIDINELESAYTEFEKEQANGEIDIIPDSEEDDGEPSSYNDPSRD